MTSAEAAALRDLVLFGAAEVPSIDPRTLARAYVALLTTMSERDRRDRRDSQENASVPQGCDGVGPRQRIPITKTYCP